MKYRIQDMEEQERPRERLEKLGPQALKIEELLAILLRVGVPGENALQMGQRLLHDLGGLRGIQQATFTEVCNQHGLGPAKAAQIKAAIELGCRLQIVDSDQRPHISKPQDAADLVQYEMAGLVQEQLWVLVLDTRNRVISTERCIRARSTPPPLGWVNCSKLPSRKMPPASSWSTITLPATRPPARRISN